MHSIAAMIMNHAASRKVDYADVRVIRRTAELISVRNEAPESVEVTETFGVGVRVLVDGRWGFAATNDIVHDRLDGLVERAILGAKAAAAAGGPREHFDPPPTVTATHASFCEVDPRSVPLAEKLSMLTACTRVRGKEKSVEQSEATMDTWHEDKVFYNTLGSQIEQSSTVCGAGISAGAIGSGDIQTRSYPNSFGGNYAQAGYEFIDAMRLEEHAAQTASEAATLLRAPICPDLPEADLIIGSSQLALQIHESVGHAIEFDRILGYEASFAGTSFLQPSDVGSRTYGAALMNVTADATVPHGLGTFHYDDEGYPAVRDAIVEAGKLVGVLTSAGTAHVLNRRSNACMRAEGWNHFPIIRMTNVNLEPGEAGSLEDLIADTDHGYLLDTNKSWSIDDKRLNFQFATESAVEIRNGKRGRLFRNPIYSGITPAFWASCDAICGSTEWQLWGVTNCGKGEPMQVAQVSHGCSPARFRKQRLWGA